MNETYLERRVTKHAINQGWLPFKLNVFGLRGLPDRIYLGFGRCFFIEFKSKTGRLSKIQFYRHQMLKSYGLAVYVVNNAKDGKVIIDEETRHAANI